MATTRSLDSNNDVYVTTYYAGDGKGRYYKLVVNFEGKRLSKAFSQRELFEFLGKDHEFGPDVDDGIRPEFDN